MENPAARTWVLEQHAGNQSCPASALLCKRLGVRIRHRESPGVLLGNMLRCGRRPRGPAELPARNNSPDCPASNHVVCTDFPPDRCPAGSRHLHLLTSGNTTLVLGPLTGHMIARALSPVDRIPRAVGVGADIVAHLHATRRATVAAVRGYPAIARTARSSESSARASHSQ